MANPHRGEVAFQAGDKTYTLRFSVNAICELEDRLDMPIGGITDALGVQGGVSMRTIRAIVWAGLQDHHPGLDERAAGAIISDLGVQQAVEKVGEAFKQAFPKAEASGGARPPKARSQSRSTS